MIGIWLAALLTVSTGMAQTWSTPRPVAVFEVEGLVTVPANMAVLVEGSDVVVRDALGNILDTVGQSHGVLVPAAGFERQLQFDGSGRLRLRWLQGRLQRTAWDRWWVEALRAERRGERVPSMPGGLDWVRASIELRSRALAESVVVRQGMWRDVEMVAPLGSTTHVVKEPVVAEVDQPLSMTVVGPGVALVRITPHSDVDAVVAPMRRLSLAVDLDGNRQLDVVQATVSATRSSRVWVPPGTHVLDAEVSGGSAYIEVELQRSKGRLLSAPLRPGVLDGVDEAERLYLLGHHGEAAQAFARLVEEPGAVGELARARVMRLATDPLRFAEAWRPEDFSTEGQSVAAMAVLHRADELPVDVVARWVLAADAVDPVAVAVWLDEVGGTRPAGLALLSLATREVPTFRSMATEWVRRANVASRFVQIDPVEGPSIGVSGAQRVFVIAGPGVPRARLRPGITAAIELPAVVPGRVPLLKLFAEGPVRFNLDGERIEAPEGGDLWFALEAGPHTVRVESGELMIVDPSMSSAGDLVYERWAVPLPTSYELPDPGVPVDLRLHHFGGDGLLARFDDGRITRGTRDALGRVSLQAGSHATRLDLEGEGWVTMEIRCGLEPVRTPVPAATDLDATLAEVRAWTERVDGGEHGARVERAVALASVGALSLGRADLLAIADHGEVDADARHAWATLSPAVASAPRVGPWTPAAALARLGAAEGAPVGTAEDRALALESLAEQYADQALWRHAAVARLEASQPVEALLDAQRAGPFGEDLMPRIRSRLVFMPLQRADVSVGLVAVPIQPDHGQEQPLWWHTRDALLGLPWPAEQGVVLRAPAIDQLRFGRGALELSIYCRDETLGGGPCEVPLRIGEERKTLDVPDGAVVIAPPVVGPSEVEVGPVPGGRAVGVRALRDGQAVPLQIVRMALRASEDRPVSVKVAGGAVLRVQVVRGSADVLVDGVVVAADVSGRAEVPLVQATARRVEVHGDADILLYHGLVAHRATVAEATLEPVAAPRVDDETLALLLARYAHPPDGVIERQGNVGTWEVASDVTRERLVYPTEPWTSAGVGARWMRREARRWWATAGVLGRGPAQTVGGQVSGGPEWRGGFLGVGLEGVQGHGVADQVGHVRGDLWTRHDVPLTTTLGLRGELGTWLGNYGPTPFGRVDPWAWGAYDAAHWAGFDGSAGVVFRPYRDLRAGLGAKTSSNVDMTLDYAGPYAEVDLLFAMSTALLIDGSLTWRFADEHRDEGYWRPYLSTGLSQIWWVSRRSRIELWAAVEPLPDPSVIPFGGGINWLISPMRGARDLPPYDEVFRTTREAPL